MARALTVNDLVRVRIFCRLAGALQISINTLHYKVLATGATAATDLDVANQIDSVMATPYKALMTSAAEYRGIMSQILFTSFPYRAHYGAQISNSNSGAGIGAATILPHQTCGLISFKTDLAGVTGRGRLYTPFPDTAADSGGGTPSTGYVALLAILAPLVSQNFNIVSGSATATLQRVLLHGKRKNDPTGPPDPVTFPIVSNLWATQRRRGSYGRTNVSPV